MISKRVSEPLYLQIKKEIRKEIESGKYGVGEIIPTEKDLQERFEVSRITVRKAMEGLAEEGYLIKKQGVGTIIVKDAVPFKLGVLGSLSERFAEMGIKLTSNVLKVERSGADEEIAKKLGIKPGAMILLVKRLRKINGDAAFVATSYINGEFGLSADEDFTGSLCKIYEARGIKIAANEVGISATLLSKENAALLHVRKNEASLEVTFLAKNSAGKVVEYTQEVFRKDIFDFKL